MQSAVPPRPHVPYWTPNKHCAVAASTVTPLVTAMAVRALRPPLRVACPQARAVMPSLAVLPESRSSTARTSRLRRKGVPPLARRLPASSRVPTHWTPTSAVTVTEVTALRLPPRRRVLSVQQLWIYPFTHYKPTNQVMLCYRTLFQVGWVGTLLHALRTLL